MPIVRTGVRPNFPAALQRNGRSLPIAIRRASGNKAGTRIDALKETAWKTGGSGRIFREWRQSSYAIAAPSTNVLKQSSWYRIRSACSAGLC